MPFWPPNGTRNHRVGGHDSLSIERVVIIVSFHRHPDLIPTVNLLMQ